LFPSRSESKEQQLKGGIPVYILANALKNLGRNKGRNILIGIMIFLIITASMVTLCINNTTRSIIDDYKNRFGSEVTIGADLTQLVNTGTLGTYQAPPAITPQQYLRFAESEYLKESRILASATAGGESIKAVDESENGNVQFGGGITLSGATQTEGDPYVSPKLNLFANKWSDFEEGNRELYEGKMPEKTGECIVSKELAELNDWKVGDKIQLESSVLSVEDSKQTIKNKTVELTLTGIYLDGTEPYSSQFKMPLMNRRNEVLTTLDTLLANYPNTLSVSAKYYLKKPSLLKSFDAELRAKGLDDYYKVSTDEAGYQKVVGPVEGLKKVALTFMLIVLIFGGVILVLLGNENMRSAC